jgi:hypothetical protein
MYFYATVSASLKPRHEYRNDGGMWFGILKNITCKYQVLRHFLNAAI